MAMTSSVTAGLVKDPQSISQLRGPMTRHESTADTQQSSDELHPTASRRYRFVMAIPVLYRTAAKAAWELGITVDISESGVLLEASRSIPVDSLITLTFELPEAMGRLKAGQLACVGRVVRHGAPSGAVPYPFGIHFLDTRVCPSADTSRRPRTLPDRRPMTADGR